MNISEKTKKHRQIIEHWETKVYEGDMGCDWSDAHNHCWRCGKETKSLEMCHIIAEQFSGKKTPDNLVLLCKSCHKEAPDFNEKDKMWDWIKRTSEINHTTFLDKELIREYKYIFGDDITTKIQILNVLEQDPKTKKELKKIVENHYEKAGFHGFEISRSTHCYVIIDIIDEVINNDFFKEKLDIVKNNLYIKV